MPRTLRYSLIIFFCSLPFTDCSLLAVCFFLLASWLFFFVRRSPFAARYTLLSVCCSLFPNSLITVCFWVFTSHCQTDRCTQLSTFFSIIASCYSFLDTHFPYSVAAGSPIFSLSCSLLASHNLLVACKTLSLIVHSSLLDVCCPPPADRFSLLGSCFLLLGCAR